MAIQKGGLGGSFTLPKNKVKAIFPPKKGAKIHQHGNSKKKPKMRDVLVRGIRKFGRAVWKKSRVSSKKYCRDCYVSIQDNLWGSSLLKKI